MSSQSSWGAATMTLAAVASVVALWWGISRLNPAVVPGPAPTASRSLELLTSEGPRGYTGSWHLVSSLFRVTVILFVSNLVSVFVGTAMSVRSDVEDVVSMWLPVWLIMPDVVIIILVMTFLGFNQLSVVVSISFTTSIFGIVNVWEGMKSLNERLLEMGVSFGAGPRLRWRYIYLPHITPYVLSNVRFLLGMTWKIVLVGEAFGLQTGLGTVLRFWYKQGEVLPILSYLFVFVVLVFAIEYLLLRPAELYAARWRTDYQP